MSMLKKQAAPRFPWLILSTHVAEMFVVGMLILSLDVAGAAAIAPHSYSHSARSRGPYSPGSSVVRTVPVGQGPGNLAVDHATQRVFVLDGQIADGTSSAAQSGVSVLDAHTGQLLHTLLFARSTHVVPPLVVDERRGHVFLLANSAIDAQGNPTGTGSLLVLDATTGRLQRTIRIGPTVDALAMDAPAARIYIGLVDRNSAPTEQILVLDTTTERVRSVVHNTYVYVSVSTNTYGGPLIPDTRTGRLIVNEGDDVLILDIATGHRRTVRVYGLVDDVAVDEQAGHVIVSNRVSNDPGSAIQVVDEATGQAINKIPSYSSSDPANDDGGDHLTVDKRAGRVFASLRYSHYSDSFNNLNVASTRDGRFVNSVSLNQDGAAAVEIAVNERAGHTYVAVADYPNPPAVTYQATQIDVFDDVSGRIINHLTVGHGPPALAVDAQDRRLFVANGGDNTVTVLDTTHL